MGPADGEVSHRLQLGVESGADGAGVFGFGGHVVGATAFLNPGAERAAVSRSGRMGSHFPTIALD